MIGGGFQMESIIEGIKTLGIPTTITISLTGLFLVLQIIGEFCEFKGKIVPEFLKIRKYFKRKREEKEEMANTIKECKQIIADFNQHYTKDNISQRNTWMHNVDESVQEIQKLDGKIDKLLDANKDLKDQLDQVKSNVLVNEADRLRSELFDCGNRCRRKIRLHPEEMDHIRAVYTKYSEVLHQNGPGEAEFKFINDYYNKQDFPDYHQKNTNDTTK